MPWKKFYPSVQIKDLHIESLFTGCETRPWQTLEYCTDTKVARIENGGADKYRQDSYITCVWHIMVNWAWSEPGLFRVVSAGKSIIDNTKDTKMMSQIEYINKKKTHHGQNIFLCSKEFLFNCVQVVYKSTKEDAERWDLQHKVNGPGFL